MGIVASAIATYYQQQLTISSQNASPIPPQATARGIQITSDVSGYVIVTVFYPSAGLPTALEINDHSVLGDLDKVYTGPNSATYTIADSDAMGLHAGANRIQIRYKDGREYHGVLYESK
jgi:homospermidine synthase